MGDTFNVSRDTKGRQKDWYLNGSVQPVGRNLRSLGSLILHHPGNATPHRPG
jgi:hypothetical protein